ncbi:MAG: DNA-3-methyladenine glycosylase [Bacteroidota bacterium]
MYKLTIDFFNRDNVVQIAKELIGKILVTNFNGVRTSGRIVETEAYVGLTDKASHSFAGKRTPRNEHMYAQAGTAYIYVCYGIHQMFNIVTNSSGVPDAILVRALDPLDGIDFMLERTGKLSLDFSLTRGPGNVGKALGFNKRYSGYSLAGGEIFIEDDNIKFGVDAIRSSPRIGVAYAGVDARLPYRFYFKGNRFVSGKPNN